jgi:outer membrane protein assembly factor BamB
MARDYRYDLAISFAGKSRAIAREIAAQIKRQGCEVFFDEDQEHELWGRNGKAAFARVYGEEARFCLVLISDDYDRRAWTVFEREVIEARQMREPDFLLPVMTDSYRPKWLPATRIYFDLGVRTIDDLFTLIMLRLGEREAPKDAFKRSATAKVEWMRKVGRGTWKNEPVPYYDRVFFPTAGHEWNKADTADGIYCIERSDGFLWWQAKTEGDANSLAVIEERLIVGTDRGFVHCFDAEAGSHLWSTRFEGAVLARPVRTSAGIVICTTQGELGVLDLESGRKTTSLDCQGPIVADPTIREGRLYVATTNGWLNDLSLEELSGRSRGGSQQTDVRGRSIPLTYLSQHHVTGQAPCGLHATPVFMRELVVLPFVRPTYFSVIPLAAVNLENWEQVWRGVDSKFNNHFGNIRSTPAVKDDLIITPVAYGNEVLAVDSMGAVEWSCHVGHPYFRQWGSPAIHKKQVLVPRFDGYVHSLRITTGRRCWSIFLGGEVGFGRIYGLNESLPGEDLEPDWENSDSCPLNSPVAVVDDDLFVLNEGGLACRISLGEGAS